MMDTAGEYEFVISFLSSVEFSLIYLLVTMLCNERCIEPFEMKVNTFDLLVLQKSCSFFCWQCLLEDFSFLLLEVFAGAPRQDLSIIAPAIGE